MSEKRVSSITPPNQAYPREEMETMVEKWLQANVDAEKDRDWTTHLGPMYTEDAVYTWNMGPHEEFVANGRKEICDIALGYQMEGFEGWEYPYHDIIIDDRRGTVLGFWKQMSPYTRADGSRICVEGIGGSWFEYAGNYQWGWQRDFFDLGNVKALFFELAGMNALSEPVKDKIRRQAKGELLAGHRKLGDAPSAGRKLRNFMAMARIATFGR
ncbi:hypothetical protein [Algiphilus aromaticivorans]|jgi:hypothetical protein|uniref:hypothetical protein n=1 Tax=Algiphilus aromaticivorans TaxID=382454 RepID=UPI000693B564|nr:hypothetical protein [Algiphilus aromaticivorans]